MVQGRVLGFLGVGSGLGTGSCRRVDGVMPEDELRSTIPGVKAQEAN